MAASQEGLSSMDGVLLFEKQFEDHFPAEAKPNNPT
jgi:hypothetical protein